MLHRVKWIQRFITAGTTSTTADGQPHQSCLIRLSRHRTTFSVPFFGLPTSSGLWWSFSHNYMDQQWQPSWQSHPQASATTDSEPTEDTPAPMPRFQWYYNDLADPTACFEFRMGFSRSVPWSVTLLDWESTWGKFLDRLHECWVYACRFRLFIRQRTKAPTEILFVLFGTIWCATGLSLTMNSRIAAPTGIPPQERDFCLHWTRFVYSGVRRKSPPSTSKYHVNNYASSSFGASVTRVTTWSCVWYTANEMEWKKQAFSRWARVFFILVSAPGDFAYCLRSWRSAFCYKALRISTRLRCANEYISVAKDYSNAIDIFDNEAFPWRKYTPC